MNGVLGRDAQLVRLYGARNNLGYIEMNGVLDRDSALVRLYWVGDNELEMNFVMNRASKPWWRIDRYHCATNAPIYSLSGYPCNIPADANYSDFPGCNKGVGMMEFSCREIMLKYLNE